MVVGVFIAGSAPQAVGLLESRHHAVFIVISLRSLTVRICPALEATALARRVRDIEVEEPGLLALQVGNDELLPGLVMLQRLPDGELPE